MAMANSRSVVVADIEVTTKEKRYRLARLALTACTVPTVVCGVLLADVYITFIYR